MFRYGEALAGFNRVLAIVEKVFGGEHLVAATTKVHSIEHSIEHSIGHSIEDSIEHSIEHSIEIAIKHSTEGLHCERADQARQAR